MADIEGPVADLAKTALESRPPNTLARAESHPIINPDTTKLRGQPEFLAMLDDRWDVDLQSPPADTLNITRENVMSQNLSTNQMATTLGYYQGTKKGKMCLDLAMFLFKDLEVKEDSVQETAIDLMSLPIMNIEHIHIRLGLNKTEVKQPKLLNRFQILKKE